MSLTPIYQCQQCQKTYSNSSHLRRHEKLHTSQTTPCAFCPRRFVRRDVAHRHSKTCREKGSNPIPNAGTRGRKRKACDPCAAAKLACDEKLPCTRCIKKTSHCTYRNRQTGAVRNDVARKFEPPLARCFVRLRRCEELSLSHSGATITKNAMPFLLNYTNPATKSISACYKSAKDEGEYPFDHQCAVDTHNTRSDNFVDTFTLDDAWPGEWAQLFEDAFMFGNSEEQWWDEIIRPRNSGSQDDVPDCNCLQASMTQIACDIKGLHRLKHRTARDSFSFDEETFKSLFTPHKMIEFTKLYFDCWSPHCPILHRPTFDLTKVQWPLLLAVCLIGEAYSSELDAPRAQTYYDIVEEYAFSHPKFRELLQDELPSSPAPSASLEALQAAYLMVLLQMSGSNVFSRQRVRRSRYNEVTQAARGSKLFESKNEFLDYEHRDYVDFDWHGFVAKESRIRLAYLIFGIESNFAMFHSHYPRIAVSEMTGDPMYSEMCFSATSGAVCQQYAEQEEDHAKFSSLADLSPMNFFFVLCGLHCAIHASRANGTGNILYSAITRALDRWIRIWDSQTRNLPVEEWKKLGFMRDAGPEFWQLACIFVEADARGLLNTERLRGMGAEKMESVSHLLETFSSI